MLRKCDNAAATLRANIVSPFYYADARLLIIVACQHIPPAADSTLPGHSQLRKMGTKNARIVPTAPDRILSGYFAFSACHAGIERL